MHTRVTHGLAALALRAGGGVNERGRFRLNTPAAALGKLDAKRQHIKREGR